MFGSWECSDLPVNAFQTHEPGTWGICRCFKSLDRRLVPYSHFHHIILNLQFLNCIPPTMSPESEHQPFLPKSDRRSPKGAVLSNFFVFAITSLLWLVVVIISLGASNKDIHTIGTTNGAGHRHNVTTDATLITCGNSAAEARSLGCKYDTLLNHWVPAPCYDEEWIAEYQDDGSWGAYANEDLTGRLTRQDMEESDFYYTSLRDHVNHCAAMWNKQFWALYEERRALDTIIASPGHTEHCAQFLMDAVEMNATQATKTFVGFAGCWIREG